MKIRRFERRDELFNRSIPSFVNIIDNRINLKGKKRNNFESDPFENKGKENPFITHNTENGREIDTRSALEALKLRGSEVGQAIRVDGAPYCCGASGNEAWPSVANPNQRTVPVRSCKRRFHCRRSNVVELLSLWLELE